jgi:hypothetical protein
MKKILFALSAIAFNCQLVQGQVSGNINYLQQTRLPESNIEVSTQPNVLITVKGIANIKADSYVAIFNLTQAGENIEELSLLAENRISAIRKKFEGKTDMEFYTDMISFVPVYEYEVEKKLFSKKTYNEIPKGFELKVNLHIKYKDPNVLSQIVTACAASEIYDLVRVDYFSTQLEQVKKDLAAKAKILLKEKLKFHQELLGIDFTTYKKQMADAYKVVYPLEMYKSYQAYSSSSLSLKKSATTTQIDKSTTQYYQPVLNKEFDFVINPEIVEPVIQVMYDVTFLVVMPEDKPMAEKTKEYLLVTPTGEIKNLSLKP